jgi:hypothetical protein
MTLSITTGATTLSITTLSITTLIITTPSINDTHHKINSAQRIKCHTVVCCDYFNVMQSVVMLNVVMLGVVILNVVLLSVLVPNCTLHSKRM